MSGFTSRTEELLIEARNRGTQIVGGMPAAAGLDHFTAGVGLISSALELGKLIQTEQRDMAVIGSHHEIAMREIETATEELRLTMLNDFASDESDRSKTHEAILELIRAGYIEVANEFHKRLMESRRRSSLETLVEGRNARAGAFGGRINLR